jgi:hypothetical protein
MNVLYFEHYSTNESFISISSMEYGQVKLAVSCTIYIVFLGSYFCAASSVVAAGFLGTPAISLHIMAGVCFHSTNLA